MDGADENNSINNATTSMATIDTNDHYNNHELTFQEQGASTEAHNAAQENNLLAGGLGGGLETAHDTERDQGTQETEYGDTDFGDLLDSIETGGKYVDTEFGAQLNADVVLPDNFEIPADGAFDAIREYGTGGIYK